MYCTVYVREVLQNETRLNHILLGRNLSISDIFLQEFRLPVSAADLFVCIGNYEHGSEAK